MGNSFLLQATVYLAAAVVFVPLAKRLGMGSVLGYLIAGVVVGPFLLGFIGDEGEDIMHFAEFGVVMMLFLIGLELEPVRLWKMRRLIFGTGLTQVFITTGAAAGLALLAGQTWQASLAIGLSLAMSSTAIVLQTMKEKNLMNQASGRNSFAILLFQDLAVIPILALLPLLALNQVQSISDNHGPALSDLPGWLQTLVILAAITSIVAAGKYAISPILQMVAKTRIRELFTASALLIVVGITLLMGFVGLSPALGTFLAGVILANSAFKHELESDLEPFKGLLLGLFFMAVGASINFRLIGENPVAVVLITVGLVALKALVLFLTGKLSRLSFDQNMIVSMSLSQVGEFAFVTLAFAGQLRILPVESTEFLMVVTALSMSLTPVLLLINEKLILPRVGTPESVSRPADTIDEKNRVIIAGFSHFGSTLGRFLRANGVQATILDNDSDRVDLLRRLGFKVYYGDVTRVDLLESAGAHEAAILVSAIDDPDVNFRLVETVKKYFPHLQLMVRTRNRFDAYELMELDISDVYREHLDTSVRMGVDVLRKLGFRHYTLQRSAQQFIRYDEAAMKRLYKLRNNRNEYITASRTEIEQQEELLNHYFLQMPSENDHAWDSDEMKKVLGEVKPASK